MCWISISRTSSALTIGLIASRAWSRKSLSARAKSDGAGFGLADRHAQGVEHLRQVGAKLGGRGAELGQLGPLIGEELLQEGEQGVVVGKVGAHRLATVLAEDGGARVLVDDVVVGIAAVDLQPDLSVEIVLAVLGLPIAERFAKDGWDQGSIHGDMVAAWATAFPFVGEDEVMGAAHPLQQVTECLAQDALVQAAGDAMLLGKRLTISVDVLPAHAPVIPTRSRLS
jgi:hypothetical protein